MAYKDRYGITKIRNKRIYNLAINWDADVSVPDAISNKSRRYPVILFTPNMNDTNEHYHIQLNRKETKELRDWLTSFLKDTKQKGKK